MSKMQLIRPSARYLLVRMLATFFVVDTIYALIIITTLSLNVYQSFSAPALVALLILHTVKFVILALILADLVIRFLSVRYYVTKHHLIFGSGVMNNEEKTYELSQIRRISVYQDWLGKRLNYGTVHLLLTAPGFEEKIHLVNVSNPSNAAAEIEKFLGSDFVSAKESKK